MKTGGDFEESPRFDTVEHNEPRCGEVGTRSNTSSWKNTATLAMADVSLHRSDSLGRVCRQKPRPLAGGAGSAGKRGRNRGAERRNAGTCHRSGTHLQPGLCSPSVADSFHGTRSLFA